MAYVLSLLALKGMLSANRDSVVLWEEGRHWLLYFDCVNSILNGYPTFNCNERNLPR